MILRSLYTTSEDLSSIADLPNMSVRGQDTFLDCYNAEYMSPLPVYDGQLEPSFVWGKLDGSSATDIIIIIIILVVLRFIEKNQNNTKEIEEFVKDIIINNCIFI